MLATLKKVEPIPARPSTISPGLHQIPILTHGVAVWGAGHSQLWSGGTKREGINRKAGLGFMFACLFVGDLFFFCCFGGAFLVTAFKLVSQAPDVVFVLTKQCTPQGIKGECNVTSGFMKSRLAILSLRSVTLLRCPGVRASQPCLEQC